MGKKEKWSSLGIVMRDGTGDSGVERSSLLGLANLATWAMVRSQPELQLRAMTGSMTTQWQGSMLMSVTHSTTREHGDIPSQDSHRGPHGCPGAV